MGTGPEPFRASGPAELRNGRMLNPTIFGRLPLHSADSTNVAQNNGLAGRFGIYTPPTASQRAAVIADRIEHAPTAAVWVASEQESFFAWGGGIE